MIYGKLMGGLGNQLFIYAFCKQIVNETGQNAILLFTETDRPLELQRFALDPRIEVRADKFDGKFKKYDRYVNAIKKVHPRLKALKRLLITIAAKNGVIYDLDGVLKIQIKSLKRKKDIFFCSYVQDRFSAEKNRAELLHEIECDGVVSEQELQMVRESESVCVHIRRGDYLSDIFRDRYLVCTEEYYRRAFLRMAELFPNSKFYIFSDELDWVREHYSFIRKFNHQFIGNNDELSVMHDFLLMKECKHFILSNSSLSWWVQFLGSKKDKYIIAPSKWMNDDKDYRDLYQNEWELIDP